MRLAVCALFTMLTTPALAEPSSPTLTAGELYGSFGGWSGNAYTVPKGDAMIHPLLRSGFGVADNVDLKTSFAGLILGPQVSTEITFASNERLAASVEPRVLASWTFDALLAGVLLKVSGGGEKVLVTGGLALSYSSIHTDGADLNGDNVPDLDRVEEAGLDTLRPELTVELIVSDPSRVVLTARSNVMTYLSGGSSSAIGAYYAHGKNKLGVSAGLNIGVLDVTDINDAMATAYIEPYFENDTAFLAAPHLQLWFRL